MHVVEWLCEAIGTMVLLLGGLSAICLDFGSGSWLTAAIPSVSIRLLITGALFAGTGSLVAVSPIGRRSGAHLNPAITLAFWVTGHVHPHDVAGYWVAQVLGAIAGTAAVGLLWGDVAGSVHDGVTQPAAGLSPAAVFLIELGMTAVLVATIIGCLSSRRLMRWTPVATWVAVTLLVWQGATHTGTSLNPARSLGPAIVGADFHHLWIYLTAPLLAGAVVGGLARMAPRLRPVTARLFEDRRYPTTMGSLSEGRLTPCG